MGRQGDRQGDLMVTRSEMPRSPGHVFYDRLQQSDAQFDTLRFRLIKIAARVIELTTKIRLHLPTAWPHHAILRVVLGRIPRLVT